MYYTMQIGRETSCGLRLRSPRVSRLHAELVWADSGVALLTDAGSTHGTFVANKGKWEAIRHLELKSGMRVKFADTEYAADDLIRIARELERGGPVNGGRSIKPGVAKRNPDTGEVEYA